MRRRAGRATLTALFSVGLLAAGPLVVSLMDSAGPVGAATLVTTNPTDPYFGEQWALRAIHAPAGWARSTGAGVRIGIVDTGVDLAHEDLAGKIVASTSCIESKGVEAACHGNGADDDGHGTDVAGIAAADTNNGKGVAGVAPGADLVVVKALGATGSGALDDVNAGIVWAVDHGARVVNLSLETDGASVAVTPGQSLAVGVDYAWHHGAIAVVAAGNATPSLFGPTGYAGVDAVIVGATGPSNEVAWYSSPLDGAKWGLVAPGGDSRNANGSASCAGALAAGCVVSTGWFPGQVNQYADDEGTSMATPQVSGVLALLLATGLTPTQAIARLLTTADKISCGASCHGLVDAGAALGAPGSAERMAGLVAAPAPTQPVPTPTTVLPAPADVDPGPTGEPTPVIPAAGAARGSGAAPAPTTTAPTPPTSTPPTTPGTRQPPAMVGRPGRAALAASSSSPSAGPSAALAAPATNARRWWWVGGGAAALVTVALTWFAATAPRRRRIFG